MPLQYFRNPPPPVDQAYRYQELEPLPQSVQKPLRITPKRPREVPPPRCTERSRFTQNAPRPYRAPQRLAPAPRIEAPTGSRNAKYALPPPPLSSPLQLLLPLRLPVMACLSGNAPSIHSFPDPPQVRQQVLSRGDRQQSYPPILCPHAPSVHVLQLSSCTLASVGKMTLRCITAFASLRAAAFSVNGTSGCFYTSQMLSIQ